MALTFTFKGVASSYYSILITRKPVIPVAKRRAEYIPIDGRHGYLTVDDETYDTIPIPVECSIADVSDANLRAIRAWLTGAGDLIFSDETDKVWKARVDEKIDYKTALLYMREFVIMFDCFPLAYAITNNMVTKTTSPATLINTGTVPSDPIIKVYGTGSINLTINGKIINLTNVSSYVTVDSELVDCYKDTTLKNNDMTGDFPELIPGTNNISWTGTVTKIEITPNWRYL